MIVIPSGSQFFRKLNKYTGKCIKVKALETAFLRLFLSKVTELLLINTIFYGKANYIY